MYTTYIWGQMTAESDPQTLLPLPPHDVQLLLALREGPLHGYGMMKAVEAQSRGRLRVELGSLYRMLQRLERDGLIEEAEGLRDGSSPGRERRSYRTTRLGNAVLAAELDRLRSLLDLAAGLRPGEAHS